MPKSRERASASHCLRQLMVYHSTCLQPSSQDSRTTSYPACMSLAECTGDKVSALIFPNLTSCYTEEGERVHARIRLFLFCSETPHIPTRVPGVGGTDHLTIPKHLSSLFCFNCRGLITALQIPSAWGNQHVYFQQDNQKLLPR